MNARSTESLLAGLFYLGAARAAVVCMNLITTSRMAHALGAENFGISSFAASYIAYFVILVNLGFETFVTREVALDTIGLRKLIESVIAIRLLLGIALTVVLFASLPALGLTPPARTVVLIQGANLFSSAIGLTCIYQGLKRMRVVAWRECAGSFANMIGIIWAVHSPNDLIFAAGISAATLFLTNGLLFMHYASEFGFPKIRLPGRSDFRLAHTSMVYFWSMLMITITYNTHIVLLGLMRNELEVGLFSASWKLFTFTIVLPNLIAAMFFPRIVRPLGQSAERERATTGIFMQTIIVCAVPITVLGGALIPQILTVLFGPAYLPASGTLALLLLNGLVVSLNIGLGTSLTAVGRQKAFLRVVAVGASVGVALNLLLIPFWGAKGAALATLTDEVIILGLFLWDRPEVPVEETVEFGMRCLVAVIPAATVAHFVPLLSVMGGSNLAALVGGGAAGMIVYVLALHLLRIPLAQFTADLRRVQ